MDVSDKEQIFGIDETNVTFNSKFNGKSKSRCSKCCQCLVMLLAVFIALLCVAAVVVFGVLYYRLVITESVGDLAERVAELEAQLNKTQSMLESSVEAQMSSAAKLDAQINKTQSMLSSVQEQMSTTVPTVIQEQIDETRADFVQGMSDISDRVSTSQRATYVRWGSGSCPDVNGTTLVYSGYTGGNWFGNQGGASNHLCMPTDPEYTLPFEAGIQGASNINGAEYESVFLGTANRNAVCAVCSVSTRAEVIMIPAKTSCPADWTNEYIGYIMSERTTNYRTMYICVDTSMGFVPNSFDHMDSTDLWNTEANCASLPCPPYNDEQELGCVVCSK